MPSEPQVAVLMAVHAGADVCHLAEAIASIRAQSHTNLRLFIYCDGPLTAEHERVLGSALRTHDEGDVLVRGDKPVGLPTGLNGLIDIALRHPDIEYLARMDADDLCLPQRIQAQVRHLQEHAEVSILGTWCIEFSEPGVPMFYKQLPSDPDKVLRFMLYRSPLAHPTVMFRRAVFEAGHRYDPSMLLMQDYELWSRLIAAGYVISNVPEYLLWYRMAEGFFGRRTGVRRAWREVRLRFDYARQSGLLRPTHFLGFFALFLVRVLPAPVKRIAYMHLR